MLNPSMQDLMKNVNNRYLLVNLAAQRARDIALGAEQAQEKIPEKPVEIALEEIAEGKIVHCDGPKPEPESASLDEVFGAAALEEDLLEDAPEADADVTEEQ